MKPILFNTEMVMAIQDDRKTATRRVLKNQDGNAFCAAPCEDEDNGSVDLICENEDETKYALYNKAPYQVGDILYVKETWAVGQVYGDNGILGFDCIYKAGMKVLPVTTTDFDKYCEWSKFFDKNKWHPSIHMPKDAARIFLRVTGVRAERLQDMTLDDFCSEGVGIRPEAFNDPENAYWQGREAYIVTWNSIYASPQPVKENGKIVRYESYPWEDIRETRTYRGLPWLVIGNPFVWVIEFEKIKSEDIHNE